MTLREVFDELAGGGDADPAEVLADRGYGELPDPLLSEAIVSYADTAPVEVAEHLAPFVMVHSAVPVDLAQDVPASDGLGLLATAPEAITPDEAETDDHEATEPGATEPEAGDLSYRDDVEFEFGHGAEAAEAWAGIPSIDGPEPEFATGDIERESLRPGELETSADSTDGTEDMADFEPGATGGAWFTGPDTTAAEQDRQEDDGEAAG